MMSRYLPNAIRGIPPLHLIGTVSTAAYNLPSVEINGAGVPGMTSECATRSDALTSSRNGRSHERRDIGNE
jgi:hypothetical protein